MQWLLCAVLAFIGGTPFSGAIGSEETGDEKPTYSATIDTVQNGMKCKETIHIQIGEYTDSVSYRCPSETPKIIKCENSLLVGDFSSPYTIFSDSSNSAMLFNIKGKCKRITYGKTITGNPKRHLKSLSKDQCSQEIYKIKKLLQIKKEKQQVGFAGNKDDPLIKKPETLEMEEHRPSSVLLPPSISQDPEAPTSEDSQDPKAPTAEDSQNPKAPIAEASAAIVPEMVQENRKSSKGTQATGKKQALDKLGSLVKDGSLKKGTNLITELSYNAGVAFSQGAAAQKKKEAK